MKKAVIIFYVVTIILAIIFAALFIVELERYNEFVSYYHSSSFSYNSSAYKALIERYNNWSTTMEGIKLAAYIVLPMFPISWFFVGVIFSIFFPEYKQRKADIEQYANAFEEYAIKCLD